MEFWIIIFDYFFPFVILLLFIASHCDELLQSVQFLNAKKETILDIVQMEDEEVGENTPGADEPTAISTDKQVKDDADHSQS